MAGGAGHMARYIYPRGGSDPGLTYTTTAPTSSGRPRDTPTTSRPTHPHRQPPRFSLREESSQGNGEKMERFLVRTSTTNNTAGRAGLRGAGLYEYRHGRDQRAARG